MDRQHRDEAQQTQHHPLGDPLQPALELEAAHQEAAQHRDGHPDNHFNGAGPHGVEHAVHRRALQPIEHAAGELEKVAQHPAGHGGVVHHQQAAARHAEPAVEVPLAAGGLQGLVAQHRAFAAGPAHRQLHGEDGHTHCHQEQQVEQHEHPAAVLPGDIGELPHVADAHRTPRAHQQKAQPGLETIPIHKKLPFFL